MMVGFDVLRTEIMIFLPSQIDFCLFLDNVEIIASKTVSEKKSRGRRMSKIVKSKQS